ncbi:U-box domain-containing protein 32, partial [Cucurbita argyrosperma subsp. argyrosperma]
MAAADEIGQPLQFDVEHTIFVAVGTDVHDSETTLIWAVQNFAGKKFCVLHVHQPAHLVVPQKNEEPSSNTPKEHVTKAFDEPERQKPLELLNQYVFILAKLGVQARKVWTETNSVEKGIVEIISQYSIKWLVMGLDAERYNLKTSKKAFYVCQQAPICCHIWLVCRGRLIFSRFNPSLLQTTEIGLDQSNHLRLDFVDAQQKEYASDRSQGLVDPKHSNNEAIGTSRTRLLLRNEMNKKRDKLSKELYDVEEQKLFLERKASEYRCEVKELEKKMFDAVGLLVSFREKRDKLQIEHEEAKNKLRLLKNMLKMEPTCFHSLDMPTFSFMEIIEATRNFDPSWKIGEGRHGSVYKGHLRHVDVALKMLPSYGSHSQSTFQYERSIMYFFGFCIGGEQIEILSRVRHPNLVTIIGACPESRLIVYENLKNGSLEEHLSCKDRYRPLPWQIRIRVAADICSALIFLHYNEPCIVHGDIKPSKILLDANFVAKLGGLGISRLIPRECLEIGRFTPESDVYSLGVTFLRMLTGRAASGIVKDVKCALETDKIGAVLDSSAGDWPHDLAEQLALVALRCCAKEKSDRPDLVSELWSVLEPMRSIASASFSGSKQHSRVPAHFTCPIFQEMMKDPLIAADGFTYEADAIKGWFKSGHDTSPMTNLKLEHCNLVPNYALLNAIQEWQLQL